MRGVRDAALLACWLAAASCTDEGTVGRVEDCEGGCAQDEACDMLRGTCVECDDDGCEMADECDDCAAADTACIAMLCRSCVTSADCTGEERLCVAGRCVELDDDARDL